MVRVWGAATPSDQTVVDLIKACKENIGAQRPAEIQLQQFAQDFHYTATL